MSYLREQIENWASEFVHTDDARAFPEETLAHAPGILAAFLEGACRRAGGDLGAVEAGHAQKAFLEDLPALAVPAGVRPHVPRLVEAFLGRLEADGRLADGRLLGKGIAASAPAYLEAASGKPRPFRNPGTKLGRNDPCPCGSGQKYKKCCGA